MGVSYGVMYYQGVSVVMDILSAFPDYDVMRMTPLPVISTS